MHPTAAIALWALAGCKHHDAAPRDLDQLAHAVFHDYDDPGTLSLDLIDLEGFLLGEGKTDTASEGYEVTDLTADDIGDLTRPDRDLSLLVGVAVGGISAFPVSDRAVSMIEPDQRWNDSATYDQYDRTITEGDPQGFAAGSGRIDTDNDIIKHGSFGVTIPYTLKKDFQWVDGSSGRRAIVARSWLEETGCSDNGKNCVEASFSLEFYYPDPDNAGQTIRLTVTWLDLISEADSILSENARISLLISGINDIFESTDAHLAGTE